jgi:hypothetical protein
MIDPGMQRVWVARSGSADQRHVASAANDEPNACESLALMIVRSTTRRNRTS